MPASDEKKHCPFCGSTAVEKRADFATALMVSQYYCVACNSYFEWVKWGDDDAGLDLPDFLKTRPR
ncbi:MAG: hypothetical protein D6743_06415 [Calditrichaeota bacterium]|nr:MAG: hypothetical protein D6743_06415 [Calditrichota bacterium]